MNVNTSGVMGSPAAYHVIADSVCNGECDNDDSFKNVADFLFPGSRDSIRDIKSLISRSTFRLALRRNAGDPNAEDPSGFVPDFVGDLKELTSAEKAELNRDTYIEISRLHSLLYRAYKRLAPSPAVDTFFTTTLLLGNKHIPNDKTNTPDALRFVLEDCGLTLNRLRDSLKDPKALDEEIALIVASSPVNNDIELDKKMQEHLMQEEAGKQAFALLAFSSLFSRK